MVLDAWKYKLPSTLKVRCSFRPLERFCTYQDMRESDIGEATAGDAAAGKVPMTDAKTVRTNGAAARRFY